MLRHFLSLSLSILAFSPVQTYASPAPVQDVFVAPRPTPRPMVLWHGLSDSYASPGIVEFQSMIKDLHPGIFIHSIYLEEDQDKDQRAGFYGDVNQQVELVAEQLSGIEDLRDGFDALGFSQGGQFLRAYVERYNSPPVHNLITFGSQHMGVADIPGCRPFDVLCQVARSVTKKSGAVYAAWAQNHIVQAQYYRDVSQLDLYLEVNHFLASINNELPQRNATYAANLASLNKLVLVMFAEDKTVVPKESSWFGSYAPDADDVSDEKPILPMRVQPLYVEDWIGLRSLDEKDGVVLTMCDGEHMRMPRNCWEPIVKRYVGGIV